MRMVRRADDDGIDVLALDELPIILIGPDLRCRPTGIAIELFGELLALARPLAVHIAHRDEVDAAGFEGTGHVVPARDAAAPDLPDAQPITRSRRAKDTRRHDEGEGECAGRRGHALAEFSTGDRSWRAFLHAGHSYSKGRYCGLTNCGSGQSIAQIAVR